MNVAVLHTNRLYYFYQTARLGSFSKAEDHLDVAQPALSRQVQLLEKELGAVLLERHARGVSLTENGRLVYERAAKIFGLMAEIRQSLWHWLPRVTTPNWLSCCCITAPIPTPGTPQAVRCATALQSSRVCRRSSSN